MRGSYNSLAVGLLLGCDNASLTPRNHDLCKDLGLEIDSASRHPGYRLVLWLG